MANYATLKSAIAAAIKQNGNKEITGNLLQQQLLAMVNSLGVGYQYVGIATPATNPGTPDQNVFYIASTVGTYANFGGLVLSDGEIAILRYNGAWSKDSTGAASLGKVNQLDQSVKLCAIISRGYIDVNSRTLAVTVSSTLFGKHNGIAFTISDGVYNISYSGSKNYILLVYDVSDSQLKWTDLNNYESAQAVLACVALQSVAPHTVQAITDASIDTRIDGVSISTKVGTLEISLTAEKAKIVTLSSTERIPVIYSRGYIDINTTTSAVTFSELVDIYYGGTRKRITAGNYGLSISGLGNFIKLVYDLSSPAATALKFVANNDNSINYLVLATFTVLSSKINHVAFAVMDVRLDGVSDVTKIATLETSVEQIEEQIKNISGPRQIKGIEYDSYVKAREQQLRNAFINGNEPEHWYGIEWTEEANAQNVAPINSTNDSGLQTSLPIQSKMRRCVVKNGRLMYYLDANDSTRKADGTPANLDGTDGDVMVEIPDFFYQHTQAVVNGVIHHRLKLSEQGLPGYIFMPHRFTSAYEATFDRDTNILHSVCTTVFTRATEEVKTISSDSYIEGSAYSRGTHKTAKRNGYTQNASKYRGGSNDGTLDQYLDPSNSNFERNNLGIPCGDFKPNELVEHTDFENGAVPYLYDTYRALWMLCLVEYKNRNIQQTELGMGATICLYDPYLQFFGQNEHSLSCLPCGITNSLGNNSGYVYYKQQNVPTSYVNGTLGDYADYWVPVMSYRGVENFYGHLYDSMPQILVDMDWVATEEQPADIIALGKRVADVTYYYQKNPFYIGNKTPVNLGTYRFCPIIMVYNHLLLGEDMHILPIDSDAASYADYTKHYADAVEYSDGYIKGKVLRMNGRTVSGNLCGLGFFSTNKADEIDNSQCARIDIVM